MNGQREQAFEAAEAKRQECAEWLKKFMRPGQLKPMTKDELFDLARESISISRSGFDRAWIMAIEETGRHDWYQGRRRKAITFAVATASPQEGNPIFDSPRLRRARTDPADVGRKA